MGVVQFASSTDLRENYAKSKLYIKEAADRGA
jgi:hypothetical protein